MPLILFFTLCFCMFVCSFLFIACDWDMKPGVSHSLSLRNRRSALSNVVERKELYFCVCVCLCVCLCLWKHGEDTGPMLHYTSTFICYCLLLVHTHHTHRHLHACTDDVSIHNPPKQCCIPLCSQIFVFFT